MFKLSPRYWLIKEGNTVSFKTIQARIFQNGDIKFSSVATTPYPLVFDGLTCLLVKGVFFFEIKTTAKDV